MPISNLNALVNASASEVLETMFFAEVIGEVADRPDDPLTTRLDFHGTPSGSFGLCLDRGSSRQMAAGFLGEDEQEISEEQVNEVICELTNMLCGSLLSRIDTERSFELTHPELAPVPDGLDYSNNFEIETGTLGVWLNLRENP